VCWGQRMLLGQAQGPMWLVGVQCVVLRLNFDWEFWILAHPHLLFPVIPVHLTSLNDSNYIRLYVGARLNSEWIRMWKETAAASYKGLKELTNNIRKIVNYTRRFPGPPWNCVRAVCGDCKPSDSFQKAHVIDRRTQFCSGRWTVSNLFLLSTVFPFAIYVHISALPYFY